MILLILIEAIYGICHKTAEGNKQSRREGLIDIGGKIAEVDAAAKLEADVEATKSSSSRAD